MIDNTTAAYITAAIVFAVWLLAATPIVVWLLSAALWLYGAAHWLITTAVARERRLRTDEMRHFNDKDGR